MGTDRIDRRPPAALLCAFAVACALAAGTARSDEGGGRVAIIAAGPAAKSRGAIVAALPAWAHAVKTPPPVAALAGKAKNAKARKKVLPALRALMGKQDLALVVVATVSGSGAKRRLGLLVVPRAGPPTTPSISLKGDPGDAIRAALEAALDETPANPTPTPPPVAHETPRPAPASAPAPLARATPPPPAASETPPPAHAEAEPAAPADATITAARPHDGGHDLFEIDAAFKFGTRRLAYTDTITNNIVNYHLPGAPQLALAAALFPAATTRIPVLKDLGLSGDYERSFGVSSQSAAGGALIASVWTTWDIGLRYRLRTGPDDRYPVFSAWLGYGELAFSFGNPGVYQGIVPDVRYQSLRVVVEGRVQVWRFAILASGGYRFVLSAGQLSDRFPRASIGAVDVSLGLGFRIGWGLEARVSAAYTRVFYTMNPEVGDPYVAGGALDEFLSGYAGVAYLF